jgi:hypothetical protein
MAKKKCFVVSLVPILVIGFAGFVLAGCTSLFGTAWKSDPVYQGFSYHVNDKRTAATISHFDFSTLDVAIPNKIAGLPVTAIGDSAFKPKNFGGIVTGKSLKSVKIPEGVTTIGKDAFSLNPITSITIPDSVTRIDDDAFHGCKLASVVIPAGVTYIGNEAFGYNELTNITISNGVSTINSMAFEWNGKLSSITIPASVTTLGNGVFNGCLNLASINVDPGNQKYMSMDGILFSKDGTTLIQCPVGKKISSVNVPSGVKTIKAGAFENNDLVNVSLPASLETIELGAFEGNLSLKSIQIGSNVNIQTPASGGTIKSNNAADFYDFTAAYNAGGKRAGTYVFTGGTKWSRK